VGEPLSSSTRQILGLTKVKPGRLKCNLTGTELSGQPRPPVKWWLSRHNESCLALFSQALLDYPDRVFHEFSSVVRQMPGTNAKTGHGPHSAISHGVCPPWHDFILLLWHSGFKTQIATQPRYAPNPKKKYMCYLSTSFQCAQAEDINQEGKSSA
jgi:hypothetical protein